MHSKFRIEPERNRALGRHSCRWEDPITLQLKEGGSECMNLNNLFQVIV